MQACLGTRVARLQRQVGRRFDAALRPLGLTMAQLELLAWLEGHATPVKPGHLADAMAVDRSTMSRNLALLGRHGWVETASTSPTGRTMTVTMTAAGASTLAAAGAAWAAPQADMVERLGGTAIATLNTWLTATADE